LFETQQTTLGVVGNSDVAMKNIARYTIPGFSWGLTVRQIANPIMPMR
jgi:hypothetical protein